MGNNNRWKDYFLKSGVTLEYEVEKLLDKYLCSTKFEHSFLRKDRTDVLKKFSYDLNSVFIYEMNYFDLIIERKYRDPSTNWIFLPDYKNKWNYFSFSKFNITPKRPFCS